MSSPKKWYCSIPKRAWDNSHVECSPFIVLLLFAPSFLFFLFCFVDVAAKATRNCTSPTTRKGRRVLHLASLSLSFCLSPFACSTETHMKFTRWQRKTAEREKESKRKRKIKSSRTTRRKRKRKKEGGNSSGKAKRLDVTMKRVDERWWCHDRGGSSHSVASVDQSLECKDGVESAAKSVEKIKK